MHEERKTPSRGTGGVSIRIRNVLERIHGDESGAIMMLLLASFLILFMVALVVFDAGQAAQDKMDVQIAADGSAYSHAVVKSRGMNMIAYANTIKRMIFSQAVTYVNGLVALLTTTLAHAAACAKTFFPRIRSCIELVVNLPLILSEIAEAIPDFQELAIVGNGRASAELRALDTYSEYMHQITPWWAFVENVTRSMDNGAMVTGSFPPPPSPITSVLGAIYSVAGAVDWSLGTSFLSQLPAQTNSVDSLPIARRDRMTRWSTSAGPFNFSLSQGTIQAAGEYCLEWLGSMEFFVSTLQTITQGDAPDYEWWRGFFVLAQAAGGSVGCLVINTAWVTQHDATHLDWKINEGNGGLFGVGAEVQSENDWLMATSNITYGYKPHAGRMEDDAGREKYKYLGRDEYDYGGVGASQLYRNEGYWAMARAEMTYQPVGVENWPVFNAISGIPFLGARLGIQPEPDMWSPRWTGRLRPMTLPGERHGASSRPENDFVGLTEIVNTSIPFLVLASSVGIFESDFSAQSGLRDLLFLVRAAQTFGDTEMEGIPK